MYSFYLVGFSLLAMIFLHHIASSPLAIHQIKPEMFNHIHKKLGQQRYRRFLTFFDNRESNKNYHSGDKSPLVVNDIQSSATSTTKDLLDTLGHHANRIVGGASDAVLLPFSWLSNITRYWPLYLVCATLIFGLLVFLYCSCQSKISHFSPHQSVEPTALMNMIRQQLQARFPMVA